MVTGRSVEELVVARRNLVAELRDYLDGSSKVIRLDRGMVRDLIEVLDQPTEPVVVQAEGGSVLLGGNLAAWVAEPVEVTDEARAAGLAALHADNEWHKADEIGVWRANYKRAVDLVLEAAAPLLGTRPQPTPNALADDPAECSSCGHIHTANGCVGELTRSDRWAGVTPSVCDCDAGPAVRPLPTREQIDRLLSEANFPGISTYPWLEKLREATAALFSGGEE